MAKERWRKSGPPPSKKPAPDRAGKAAADGRFSSRWRDGAKGAKSPRKESSTLVKIVAGVFGLAVVVAFIVLLLIWVSPVPPPRLATIAADYRNPLLVPNAFAVNDVVTLANQSSVLSANADSAVSLGFAEMRASALGLADLEPGRSWFQFAETKVLVYVNAFGVALWDGVSRQSVPYLLPDDFEVPVQALSARDIEAVKVADVLANLLRSDADLKILVLDCQRIDNLWPLGVLANDFVGAVDDLLDQLPESDRKGLFVLYSSAPGEVTWADRELAQSPFGHYFARGIAGEADPISSRGDGDGRVTLDELTRYVQANVSDWARSNRADTQTPRLRAFGADPARVTLVSLGVDDRFRPADLPDPSADGETELRLRDAWTLYYRMLHDSDPKPYRYAPHLWRYLEDTLLRAERFWMAGDIESMRDELRNLPSRERDLIEARSRFAVHGVGYSFPMNNFLREVQAAVDVEPNESTDNRVDRAELDAYREVVEAVIGNEIDVVEATKRLPPVDRREFIPPIEGYLIRMLDRTLLTGLALPAPANVVDESRALVARRSLAERAAAPVGIASPEISPWVRRGVDAADRARRLTEDRFFANPDTEAETKPIAVPVGAKDSASVDDEIDEAYRRAIRHAQSLDQAMKLHRRLLAEAPHLTRLVAMRPWQRADASFHDRLVTATRTLLDQTRELDGLLAVDPQDWEQRRIDKQVDEIEKISAAAAREHAELAQLLAGEMRDLGDGRGPARTQVDWRRINDILVVPFPAHPAEPEASARTRMNLNERLRQPVVQDGDVAVAGSGEGTLGGAAGESDPEQRRENALRLARLASSFYALGTGEPLAIDGGLPAEIGARVGQAWRSLYQQAVSGAVDLENVVQSFRADAARRIMEGHAATRGQYLFVAQMRSLAVARLFAWHAERFRDDFWAGLDEDNEPYFLRCARGYLDRATAIDPRPGDQFVGLKDRLAELQKLDEELRPEASETSLRFRAKDAEEVTLGVRFPPKYPSGFAALRAGVDDPAIKLRYLGKGEGSLPYRYRATRSVEVREVAQVSASLRFRGRKASLAIEIPAEKGPEGPTTVYLDERPDDALMIVRRAVNEGSNQKLLFVLDCSGSMGDNKKMDNMKRVLRRFAIETPNNALRIGVRLFGDRIPYTTEMKEKLGEQEFAALEPKARVDSRNIFPIQWFDQGRFERSVLPELRSTGGTPLFHALMEARKDFEAVRGGDKSIIVISDGMDNWEDAGIADYPGIDELREAYRETGITIHAIGFQVKNDAFGKLQQIAEVGAGFCSRADEFDQLFEEVTGLLGLLKYAAWSETTSYPNPPEPLRVAEKPIALRPGVYDVRLTDSAGAVKTSRPDVRFERGQRQEFIFEAGSLNRAGDSATRARDAIDDPASGVTLSVVDAKRRSGALELCLALFKRKNDDWAPTNVSVFVEPEAKRKLFTFQNLQPNVAGFRVPVWGFSIPDWPVAWENARIEVRWDEPERRKQAIAPIRIAWADQALAGKLPEGFGLRRDYRAQSVQGKRRGAATVKLVFPEDQPDMQAWSVGFSQPVEYARQTYDPTQRIYTGVFVLEGEVQPDDVLVYGPRPRRQGNNLRIDVEIGERVIR